MNVNCSAEIPPCSKEKGKKKKPKVDVANFSFGSPNKIQVISSHIDQQRPSKKIKRKLLHLKCLLTDVIKKKAPFDSKNSCDKPTNARTSWVWLELSKACNCKPLNQFKCLQLGLWDNHALNKHLHEKGCRPPLLLLFQPKAGRAGSILHTLQLLR